MENSVALEVKNLQVLYGDKHVVHDVSMKFPANKITAMIGASGSGKSTLLRSLNRMNDDLATVKGEINFHDLNINQPKVNVYRIRQQIGMVFQQPTPYHRVNRVSFELHVVFLSQYQQKSVSVLLYHFLEVFYISFTSTLFISSSVQKLQRHLRV